MRCPTTTPITWHIQSTRRKCRRSGISSPGCWSSLVLSLTADPLWRAGLPALGCEAALEPVNPVYQADRDSLFATAAQSNAGKPARHREPVGAELAREEAGTRNKNRW